MSASVRERDTLIRSKRGEEGGGGRERERDVRVVADGGARDVAFP